MFQHRRGNVTGDRTVVDLRSYCRPWSTSERPGICGGDVSICGGDVSICGGDVTICGGDVTICGGDVTICGGDVSIDRVSKYTSSRIRCFPISTTEALCYHKDNNRLQ